MSITPTTTVVRSTNLMSTPVDDEIVILNLAGNNYISLDAIGKSIWERIESPVAIGTLCEQLAEEYEGAPEQIHADVTDFIEQLVKDGLASVIS